MSFLSWKQAHLTWWRWRWMQQITHNNGKWELKEIFSCLPTWNPTLVTRIPCKSQMLEENMKGQISYIYLFWLIGKSLKIIMENAIAFLSLKTIGNFLCSNCIKPLDFIYFVHMNQSLRFFNHKKYATYES